MQPDRVYYIHKRYGGGTFFQSLLNISIGFFSLQNSGHQIDSKSHVNYGLEQPLPGMHKVKVKKNLLVRNIYVLITSWKIIQIESLQVNLLCYGPDKLDKNQINYMVALQKKYWFHEHCIWNFWIWRYSDMILVLYGCLVFIFWFQYSQSNYRLRLIYTFMLNIVYYKTMLLIG